MKYCAPIILFLFPSISFASVQIAEIAWMGSAESANHEWIELYNTGATVSVDGWILHDANNLTIELNGTLTSGQRAVLERTSDASAPGAAWLIYTGALANTGATLVLRDSVGEVVDQVAGGADWKDIGGNNETKETAQLQNGTWVTGAPTPGQAPNITVTSEAIESESESGPANTASASASAGSSEPVTLTLPDISLQLAIDVPSNIHVGQPVTLVVEPSGVGETIADSLVYEWSLGNGEKRSGKEIEYTFEYPGRYVVVVSGEYKRQKQFTRKTVTVLPVELTLTTSTDGQSHVLQNLSDTEINVGGYRLVGTSEHVFPTHTIILPQSEIHIPVKVAQHNQAVVALYDEMNQAVALHVPGFMPMADNRQLVSGGVARAAATAPSAASTPPPSNFGFVSDVPTPPPVAVVEPPPLIPVAMAADTNLSPAANSEPDWPFYGLIVLLLLGTAGIYLVPQKADDPPWV